MVTLASRLIPTYHDGKWGLWSKSTSGTWTDLLEGKYGAKTGLDIIEDYVEGKLAPVPASLRDVYRGKDFQGNKPTPKSIVSNAFTPAPVQVFEKLIKDPNSSSVLGSMLLELHGLSSGSSFSTNENTKTFEEGKRTQDKDIISYVALYAEALGTDPETAFNRIFTGQKITKVRNGIVIVERMPVKESQAIKKKLGGANKTMKLEHLIPVELGGSNEESNLRLVTTGDWQKFTKIDNAIIKASKAGKISKKDAQDLIIMFKNGRISEEKVLNRLK